MKDELNKKQQELKSWLKKLGLVKPQFYYEDDFDDNFNKKMKEISKNISENIVGTE